MTTPTLIALALRDLHALDDCEEPGVHDVVAKFNDGTVCYSEDVFDGVDAAQSFLNSVIANPDEQARECWIDRSIPFKMLDQAICNVTWIDVP